MLGRHKTFFPTNSKNLKLLGWARARVMICQCLGFNLKIKESYHTVPYLMKIHKYFEIFCDTFLKKSDVFLDCR